MELFSHKLGRLFKATDLLYTHLYLYLYLKYLLMIHTIDLKFLGLSENIAAFLIETSEGPVLVETGPHSTLPNLREGIKEAGFNIEDVKHVFLSHIHLDHAGAAWWFAQRGAKIYVHPRGIRHLSSPERLMESARRIYKDKMDELWGEMHPIDETQLVAVDHEASFQIGDQRFQAWHTPGHASHHIAWQRGKDLFTGDVAGVSIRGGIVIPPCPPPDINIEDWHKSTQLIRQLKIDHLYLTHYGYLPNSTKHFDQLDKRLNDWANWIKPYFDKGSSQQEITPLFQAMVIGELAGAGMDKKGQAQYEAANPSWMSVAGLMRYWKKKEEV